MIKLSELNAPKPKRKDKPRNRKQPSTKNPQTEKLQLINYGKKCYITLCYASTRSRTPNKEWFTVGDLYNFQLQKWDAGRCSDMLAQLNKDKYLTRRPFTRTNTNLAHQIRYEYKITELGKSALHYQAQNHKRRHGNTQNEED